jgi:hypothetical protein
LLGWAAQFLADSAAALGHFTAVRDAVAGRATVLRLMGRAAEAAGEARRALVLAREIGYPVAELQALLELSVGAEYAGDHDEAVRLARQITAGIPGALARTCSFVLTIVLTGAGDLAEAERAGAACLARARARATCGTRHSCCPGSWTWTLRASRTGDAAAHLREGPDLALRTGSCLDLRIGLSQCGDLCDATKRAAQA